jgi:hypothetical protein
MPEDIWSFEISADTPDQSGLILVRADSPNLFILNHSAAFLWFLRQRLPPGADLTHPYASHFGISLQQASDDVSVTLRSWSLLLSDEQHRNDDQQCREESLDLNEPPDTTARSLAFTADFSLGASSFRLTVSHDAEDFVEEIRPRLAHLLAPRLTPRIPSPSPSLSFHVSRSPYDSALRVSRDNEAVFIGSAPDAAVARTVLLQEIGRLAYDPHSEWLAILHAAALADPVTGNAVILAASTNSGKSTLAAALLSSGLRLLSDDSAAITTTRQVLSLPFALMLRSGSWPVLAPYFPDLDATPVYHRYGEPVRFLQPTSISTCAARPRHIVFIQYKPEGPEAKLQPLSRLQVFWRLQQSGFWVPHSRAAIADFVQWVLSVPAYQLTYSHVQPAVQQVHILLGPRR